MSTWLTAPDLAALAGITERKGRAALARAEKGLPWRGVLMITRRRRGRGGQSGYHLEADPATIPPALQERSRADEAARRGPLKDDQAARLEREWRFRLIQPALAHPRHSEERLAAIRAVVAGPERHPVRGRVALSERTLHRWIELHDKLGLGGLQRAKRREARAQRVFVSARWDRAMAAFDDATKATIGESVRRDLRDLWANGSPYSKVRRLGSDHLAVLTRRAGCTLPDAELAAICLLPKNVVERDRDGARRIHQFLTDRKGFNDSRSRIRRSPDDLEPMQLVLCDVHHVDVLIERNDGSIATPKLIAWMDAATHRARVDLVLCEPGTAVRNEDLIESFLDMVLDDEWGMPAGLYIDNGSEFRFADFLSDAMKLCRVYGEDADPVRRALPYEGPSKGLLEGWFRILQQHVFADLPGYIGGDRMKSLSANLGRPQLPFAGGFDAFLPVVRNGVAYLNTNERRGMLRGRTPDQRFRAWVARGWKRIDADVDALQMAFSVDDTWRVRQGKITVSLPGDPRGSLAYVHDLLGRLEGQTVRVRLPKFRRWDGIPVYSLTGERIGVAKPEQVYGYIGPAAEAGKAEAARRKRRDYADMRAAATTVGPIDLQMRIAASVAERAGTSKPESGGTVVLHGDWQADAAEMNGQPDTLEGIDAIRKAKQRREAARLAAIPPYPKLYDI